MMQYMSQAFFFITKDWCRVLCRRWESGAVECSLTCQKKAGGKFFAEKTKKIKIPVDR